MDVDAFEGPQLVCMSMADEIQISSMPEKYFNEDGTIPSRNGRWPPPPFFFAAPSLRHSMVTSSYLHRHAVVAFPR
jgi:hypothetical protein